MGLLPRLYYYILHRLFWSNALKEIREAHKEMCFREGVELNEQERFSYITKKDYEFLKNNKNKNGIIVKSQTHKADKPCVMLPNKPKGK